MQTALKTNAPKTLFAATLALAAAAALFTTHAGAQTRTAEEPGALLRSGNWGGDVGSYAVPRALEGVAPQTWPAAGWARLDWQDHGVFIATVAAPAEGQPPFLRSIVAQVLAAHRGDADTITETAVDDPQPMYLRVPGATLRQGYVPTYRFKNGTRELRPLLDHRYELLWQGKPFAFTVQNGLRTASGAAYGEGAVYTVEVDGVSHTWHLPGYGWDTVISAITDVDGDGKPDFFLSIGGPNAGTEAVLLSSQAKPGRNRPTASLTAFGC